MRKIWRAELMIDDAILAGKAMIDWIEQKPFINVFTERGLIDQLYIIVVYTSLSNLARNLESRRREGDLRGVFAFNQFSNRFRSLASLEQPFPVRNPLSHSRFRI